MTKADLLRDVLAEAHRARPHRRFMALDVDAIVSAAFAVLAAHLARRSLAPKRRRLDWPGFGAFTVARRPGRSCVLPNGARHQIDPRLVIRFRPCQDLQRDLGWVNKDTRRPAA